MQNKIVDFNALSDMGLIWKINKEILHPLGLALCRNEDGTSVGAIVAPDGKWKYTQINEARSLPKYENTIEMKKSGELLGYLQSL